MQIKTKLVSVHTADYKPVKQEVNRTVILPPLVFPAPHVLARFRCGLVDNIRMWQVGKQHLLVENVFFKWQVGQRAFKRDHIEHKDGSSEKGNRNVFFC